MEHHVVALSGGKDSTALALLAVELKPDLDPIYFITPTGDELPDMLAHWENLERLLGKALTRVTNKTLDFWIDHFNALPNFRMRWCTRLLKIEPAIAFCKRLAQTGKVTMYVGLRADEMERKGIYSEEINCKFPLREWYWGINQVKNYLREKNIVIPPRTDCARCYEQRLSEWKNLWREYPEIYAEAEAQEGKTGKTFRTPKKDAWPTSLKEIRLEFEKGRLAPGEKVIDKRQLTILDCDDLDDEQQACRVCRL